MWYYFQLQGKRISRTFSEAGMPVFLGIPLLFLLFLGGSHYLFLKLEVARFVYTGIGLYLVGGLHSNTHRRFLRSIFPDNNHYKIRMVENLLVGLPFSLYLGFAGYPIWGAGLAVSVLLFVFIPALPSTGKVLPTPFKKVPFENIRGFRMQIGLIVLAYFVCIQGMRVDNFNLSIAMPGFIFLLVMGFYYYQEKPYFVWIYHYQPGQFLQHKIKNACLAAFALNMPLILALLIVWPGQYGIILGMQIVGFMYLAGFVVARYAAFPKEMGVPQGLLFALSVTFPPMLPVVVYIFYKKARKQLKALFG